MILSPNISSSPTLRNKSVHEQLCSLSSLPAMSSLELAIGHGWPKCGTFLTCVGARKGGLSTTTISDFGTTRCQYIMATSLPAMSAVIATHLAQVVFLRQTLHRRWNQLSLLLCMAKLLDLQRLRHRLMKQSTLPTTLAPPHLSRQVILYCWLEGIIVDVAKETGRWFTQICGPFNSLGWWLVHHVSDLCPCQSKRACLLISMLWRHFFATDGHVWQLLARRNSHPLTCHLVQLNPYGCPLQYIGSGSCQVTVGLPHASVHLGDYGWWEVAYRAWHHRPASE